MQISNPLQREVFGTPGVDQFPVYDVDGFTKVSGLDPGTFVVAVFVEEALVPGYPAPVIAEIGTTGEYSIAFQTISHGRLQIEVAIAAYDFRWKGFYDVLDADTLPGQTFQGVVRDRRGNALPSIIVDVLVAGGSEVLATVETDLDGAYSIPLVDPLLAGRLVDLRFSGSGLSTRTIAGQILSAVGPQGPIGPTGLTGPQGPPGEVASGDTTIYVATTGNDGNDGSVGAPVLTLNRAVSLMPVIGTGTRIVDLAAGSYHMLTAQEIFAGSAFGVAAVPLKLQGKFSTVVSQRAATAVADTPVATITAAALGVAVDALVGARLRFVTGAHAGHAYTVASNTSTIITIDGGIWYLGIPAPGDQFIVDEPVVTLTIDATLTLRGPGALTMEGLKIVCPAVTFVGGVRAKAICCNFDLGGAFLTVDEASSLDGGGTTTADFYVGAYFHNGGSPQALYVLDGTSRLGGIFVLRNAGINSIGVVEITGLDAVASPIVTTERGKTSFLQGTLSRMNASPVTVTQWSRADFRGLMFEAIAGDAVFVDEASTILMRSCTGVGTGLLAITGYGLRCQKGSRVKLEGGVSVVGATGEVRIEDVDWTYANLATHGGGVNLNTLTRVATNGGPTLDVKLVAGTGVTLVPSSGRLDAPGGITIASTGGGGGGGVKYYKQDFGGIGGNVGDNGPPMTAALTYLALNGGKLIIEPDTYRFTTPATDGGLTGTNNNSWTVEGQGSATVFNIQLTDITGRLISWSHAGSLNVHTEFTDVCFIGPVSGVGPYAGVESCDSVFYIAGTEAAHSVIRRCNFYAIATHRTSIWCSDGKVLIDGCINAASQAYPPVFGNLAHGASCHSLRVTHCTSSDVGNFRGLSLGGGFALAHVTVAGAPDAIGPQGPLDSDNQCVVEWCHLDESVGFNLLAGAGDNYIYRTRSIEMSHCRLLVSSVSGHAGVYLYNVDNAWIHDSWIAYAVFIMDIAQIYACKVCKFERIQVAINQATNPRVFRTFTAYGVIDRVDVLDCGEAVLFANGNAVANNTAGTGADVTLWDAHHGGGVVRKKSVAGAAWTNVY